MNVFGKFEELLRIVFRTVTGNHNVTVEPSSTTSQDQTFTLPESTGATDVIVARSSNDQAGDRLTNKDLDDASTRISDGANTTQFDLTNTGSATAELPNIPDASTDRLVARNTADTLTNKTLTSPVLDGTITGTAIDTDLSDGATANTVPSSQAVVDYSDAVSDDLADHIADPTDAHAASAITNAPAGNIAASTVQGALDELDSEKVSKAGDTMSGALDMGANAITDVSSLELEDSATIDTESTSGNVDIGGSNADQVLIGRSGQTTTIRGDLQVDGTTTTVNTDTLDVEDPNISVNVSGDQATANSNVSGVTVEMTDATDARIGYDSSLASKFKAGEVGSESELVTTDDTQTLIDKTLTSPTIDSSVSGTAIDTDLSTGPNTNDTIPSALAAQTYTDAVQSNLDTHTGASSGVHGVTGNVVGTTDAQTLSNKTVDGGTLSGTTILDSDIDDASTQFIQTDDDFSVDGTDNNIASTAAIKAYVDTSVGGTSGSGSGEINHLSNPLFNANADGWHTYQSSATPPLVADTSEAAADSTVLTLTRATDYIIEGAASGKVSKSNANGQYHGWATDFTIPVGQRDKTHKVKFSYYSSDTLDWYGGLRVYVVKDVGGANTIEELKPITTVTQSNTGNSLQYESSFQPLFSSSVEDYRLLIHLDSAATSFASFWFDSVIVGPEQATRIPKEGITNLINNLDAVATWHEYQGAGSVPTAYSDTERQLTSQVAAIRVTDTTFNGTTAPQLSWAGAATGTGLAAEFILPEYLANRLLAFKFDYRFNTLGGGRSTGDIKVYAIGEDDTVVELDDLVITNTTSDIGIYSSAKVLSTAQKWRLLLHIPNSVSSSDSIVLDNLYIGIGSPSAGMGTFDGIWKKYTQTDVGALTSTPAGFSLIDSWYIASKTTDGTWFLEASIGYNCNSLTIHDFTIPGATFKNTTNFFQAGSASGGADGGYSQVTANTGNVVVRYNTARTTGRVHFKTELESKPTWADFDPVVNTMSDNVVFANARMSAYLSSNQSVSSGGLIQFDTVNYGTEFYDSTTNYEFTAPADGKYHVSTSFSFVGTPANAVIARVLVNGSASFDAYCPNGVANPIGSGAKTIGLNKGDTVSVSVVESEAGSITIGGSFLQTYLTIERVADYSAGQPISLELAGENRPGLLNYYQTVTLTADGNFTGGNFVVTRIGNVVTITCRSLTHASASGPGSSVGFLPTWARPPATTYSAILIGTSTQTRMSVNASGTVAFAHLNTSFNSKNETAVIDGSITYTITD